MATNFDTVHEDLTALQQFCVRAGKQPYIRDGEHRNSFTSSGWPEHHKDWLTFSEAVDAVQRGVKVYHEGTYQPVDGIGFLITRSGQDTKRPLGGDIDCCRNPITGLISSWAIAFLQNIRPFHTEISPSACGLRFFIWGHLPNGIDNVFGNGSQDDLSEGDKEAILTAKPKAREKLAKGNPAFNGLEIYEANRHLTVTGQKLADYCFPSEDRTDAISHALEPFLVAEAVGKEAREVKQAGRGKLPHLSILDVIDTKSFTESGGQLLGSHPTLGSTTGQNLVVDPRADVWAYMHNKPSKGAPGGDAWVWLACECGAVRWEDAGKGILRDREVVEKTLRHAITRGLIKEDEARYEIPLLERGEALLLIEDLREKVKTDPGAPFEPKYAEAIAVLKVNNLAEYERLMADLKGRTSIRDLKKAVKENVAQIAQQKPRGKTIDGIKCEDVANVEYDDRGDIASTELAPTRAADAIMKYLKLAMAKEDDQIYYFDNGIYHPDGVRIIDTTLVNAAGDAVDIRGLNEVLRRIRNSLLSDPVTFDPNPYLLGVKNGVVDLQTGTFREYRPEDLITDRIDVTYDQTAKCPKFLLYLEEVEPVAIDRLMLVDWFAIHAIREMFAYVMFLLGLGRNGKGIYERVLKRFFKEESFSEMQLEELSVKNNRFAGAALKGKRGQIVSEAGEERKPGSKRTIPTNYLKFSTGDGTIDSDQKGTTRTRFKPFYKATVDSNDMPIIGDASKGWIERFCKANMPFVFVDEPKLGTLERKKDPHLYEKLTTDSELSGILNVILSRTPELIRTKAITKRSGTEMFEEYQKQSSSVTTFLETFCDYKPISDKSKDTFLDLIFEKYEEWCNLIVADKVDDKRFGKSVKTFCKGAEPERVPDGDKKRKIYHGLSFDINRYQAHWDHYQTIKGPLKTVTGPLGPLNDGKYEVMWDNLVETYGEEKSQISSQNETKNASFFESMGLLSIHKNTNWHDSDSNGPQNQSVGPDSDLPTMVKIDRPTPETVHLTCVVCGEDLTGKSQITKDGKAYCAQPGCGYPPRGKEEAEA